MGRLIDPDELLRNEIARCGCQPLVNDNKLLKDIINEQPTAYNIDKVVEQLEELIEQNVGFMRATPEANAYIKAIRDAIEIVKGGGTDG